jgi:sugar lactone lactonase YvrE
VDAADNLFIATDTGIIKNTPAGVVTTLAVAPSLAGSSLAADGLDNLFVADTDNHRILKITPAGMVTALAGTLPPSPGSADGTGSAAGFNCPSGVAVDGAGNVYVADTANETVRRITPGGVVTTLAGTVGSSGVADGTGTTAQFSHPAGMAADSNGNVYVADRFNKTIRKIAPGGVVTTLAGDPGALGSVDGLTPFNFPFGVAVDNTGNVYWADRLHSAILKIATNGVMTTLAGVYGQYPDGRGSNDGTGTSARFDNPRGLTVDGTGNVYVADSANNTIRKITPAGVVTTLAGTAGAVGSADGNGPSARFNEPTGVAVDVAGNVFVADAGNNLIRKITPGGAVTTIGGTAGTFGSEDGIGAAAGFNNPAGVAVDRAGNLYLADADNHAIRKGQLVGPPVITTQPLSQTVAPGANVQFSVTAGTMLAPTYQWYFNGSVFNGATTSTLSFASARNADAGDYTVVVTNQLGSVTSSKATLTVSSTTVTPPPTSSGGGGSLEAWFALALVALVFARGAWRATRYRRTSSGI